MTLNIAKIICEKCMHDCKIRSKINNEMTYETKIGGFECFTFALESKNVSIVQLCKYSDSNDYEFQYMVNGKLIRCLNIPM